MNYLDDSFIVKKTHDCWGTSCHGMDFYCADYTHKNDVYQSMGTFYRKYEILVFWNIELTKCLEENVSCWIDSK